MNSIDYISENFLTNRQLELSSGVDASTIGAMMAANCLPGPAYKVSAVRQVESFFGTHSEQATIEYYPPSHVEKIKEINAAEAPFEEQADGLKKKFLAIYKELLIEHQAQDFGLAHLFDEEKSLEGETAIQFLEQEWAYYLDGTYGLCTRSASFEEIALKELAIAKIKHLTEADGDTVNDAILKDLAEAVELLDKVSAPFAPHEVARSSRNKWVNNIRDKYLSNETL